MELGNDLKQILEDFAALSNCYKSNTEQIGALKKILQEKESELATVRTQINDHRKENQERQKLVDIVEDIVAAIPDYKRKISELVECEEVVKATLNEKTEELMKMKQMHRQHMAGLEEKMTVEYSEEKEQERVRMEALAESLRTSHEEEMKRLAKMAEKEMMELEEKNKSLLEEREKMRVEQEEEEEMLRVQIAVAEKSVNQRRPSNVDIYMRKLEDVKQHYEEHLQELREELDNLKREENNFYLDIATSVGRGESLSEKDGNPKVLVTERNCGIRMSDISKGGFFTTAHPRLRLESLKTSKGGDMSGLFQQAQELFSDNPERNTNYMIPPPSSNSGCKVMDVAQGVSTPKQQTGSETKPEVWRQKQQAVGSTPSRAFGPRSGSIGVVSGNRSGVKSGKPNFKFVSKASSGGIKGSSKIKTSVFLPVVVTEPEDQKSKVSDQTDARK